MKIPKYHSLYTIYFITLYFLPSDLGLEVCFTFQKLQLRPQFLSLKSYSIYISHGTTELNTLQGYVTPVMDSERGSLKLSMPYMERLFNKHSNVWRYLQITEDIFNYLTKLKTSSNELKISSNNWINEDIFK